jgi:ribosome-associated protein
MIRITDDIAVRRDEIREEFVRSSGPGGQNVNKVATAVQLRFDVSRSDSLPEAVRIRLFRAAGKRMTSEGVLVIEAKRFRSQERNRRDALDRFIALIRKAAETPKPRKRTRPTAGSRSRRIAEKQQRSETKRLRKPPHD